MLSGCFWDAFCGVTFWVASDLNAVDVSGAVDFPTFRLATAGVVPLSRGLS